MIQHTKLFSLTIILFSLLTQYTFAQVAGISYTLSPDAEYVIWNDKAGLDNSLLVGGKVGFGFGEFFELRGNYAQSINAQTGFSRFGLPNYSDSLFVNRDVRVVRWGGDVKTNIGKGKLLPFITLGTGIQSLQLDSLDPNKQIYVNVGAGITLSLADRYTLILEAKNTAYRYNAINLLTDEDIALYGFSNDNFLTENLNNWSIGASLQFYLGGRKPGKLSALDEAYYDAFSGGFRGFTGILAPVAGQIQFNEALPYRDAWMAGANAGIDIGPYIGLRGFYWRSLEEGELTSFDQLAMYGGEVRMRLNTSAGLIPYVTIGGGNIDVNEDEYIGRTVMLNDTTILASEAKDKGFAMGGLGLTLPLSQNFKVFGSARAILTSGSPIDDFQGPEQVQTSFMYSAGLKFTIGKKAANPDEIMAAKMNEAIAAQQADNDDDETTKLKGRYETKLLDLEDNLSKALEKEDYEKAAELKKEKEKVRKIIDEIEARQTKKASQTTGRTGRATTPNVATDGSEIRMTPDEFERIIDKIMNRMDSKTINPMVKEKMLPENRSNAQTIEGEEINGRVEALENQISSIAEEQGKLEKNISQQLKKDLTDFTGQLSDALQGINDKIDDNNAQMDDRIEQLETGEGLMPKKSNKKEKQTAPKNNKKNSDDDGEDEDMDDKDEDIDNKEEGMDDKDKDDKDDIDEDDAPKKSREEKRREKAEEKKMKDNNKQKTGGIFKAPSANIAKKQGLKKKSVFNQMSYAGTSGFAGFNLGGSNTANFGIRGHYPLGKEQRFEFVPETFFGIGTSSIYGLSGNVLAPIDIQQLGTLRPYVGAGLGLMKIEQNASDELRGGFNLIVGSYLDIWKGRLYVDLSGRNFFRNNQLIAGYRLPF